MNRVIEIAQTPILLKGEVPPLLITKNRNKFLEYFLKEDKDINLKSIFSLEFVFIKLNDKFPYKNSNFSTKIKKLFPSPHPSSKFSQLGLLRDKRLYKFLQIPQVEKFLKNNTRKRNGVKREIVLRKDCFFINDRDKRKGLVFINKNASKNNDKQFFPILLKRIFRSVLGSHNGALFHASALEKHNNSFVFIGPSGKGKSTICRLLNDWLILSDETTIIKRKGKVFNAFSSPWHNDDCPIERFVSLNKGYPVRAIFFLEQSNSTRLKKVSLKETLPELLGILKIIGFFTTKDSLASYPFFCIDLLKSTSVFKLFFKKDKFFKNKFISLIKKEGLI